ncbi:MAG: succinylglutamate desuccinylase/aspartoacylase family protein, partial [SAR324 cluster bacterium]|nr:succinylglutamate desuccinylase/aspartoacylase family protein [SAR324 cluster bacterium]
IQGRIIIVPMANFPAAKAGLRTSPIDEQNLNRIYPGDPDGSPSFMIAHYIESELFSIADYGLDLHSGGSSLHYVPSVVSSLCEDKKRMLKMKELMEAFRAPYSFFFPSGHAGGTTNHAASRNNVVLIGTELGGSGTVTTECLQICERGIKGFLQACGVMQSKTEVPAPQTRMLYAPDFSYYCYAMEEGLFEPVKGLGDEVMKGEVAGYTHFPETPGKESKASYFEADGVVVCKRIPARVIRGDCVFQLGCDFTI